MGMFSSKVSILTDDYRFISLYGPKYRPRFSDDSPSCTKQSFKDECDINVLMRQYQQTGILDGRDPTTARYMDVSEYGDFDFQAAQNFVAQAKSQFYDLPSDIRSRFSNDPGALISFLDDPRNAQEAVSLGLMRDPNLPAPTVPLGTSSPVADQAKDGQTISAT